MVSFPCLTAFHGVPPCLIQTPPRGPMLFNAGFTSPFFLSTQVPRKHHGLSLSSLWAPSCLNLIPTTLPPMKLKSEFRCCFLQEVCLDNNVWVCCTSLLHDAMESYTCSFTVRTSFAQFIRLSFFLEEGGDIRMKRDRVIIVVIVDLKCPHVVK